MDLATATLLIRAGNLVLWFLVATRVLLRDEPLTVLGRRMVATVVVFGMTVFVVGALVPFGLPGQLASYIYTAFTAYAAGVALALLTIDEPGDGS